jgi:hypothetical protein
MMQRMSAIAVALIVGLSAFAARADDYVVVESSAPGIKVGTEMSASAGLTVPDKARVVLLRADGQMVTVNGPFKGVTVSTPSGASDSRLYVAITTLVRSGQQEDNVRVAAVRATDTGWRSTQAKTERDILAIDTIEGGDTCLSDPATAELVRSPSARGNVTILAMRSTGSVTVTWPADNHRMPWPKEVPLADGGSYVIEQEGRASAAITTVHVLPKEPGRSDLQRIAQLAEKGCTSQARLWLRMITESRK